MANEGFYVDDYTWYDVFNRGVGLTDEFTFAPWSPTILATAPLSAFSYEEGSVSIACSGIVDYSVENQLHPIPVAEIGLGNLFDLPGSLLVSPASVIGVTFGLQLLNQGGGGFFATGATTIHKVELWD
jgi:hypothetical protein